MVKPIVRWPACFCLGFPGWRTVGESDWDRTDERGEWVLVSECKKNLGCERWETYPYSPVKQCQRCGRFGRPRYIRYRSDCYLGFWWGRDDNDMKLNMCMSCWNKVRPIIYRIQKMHECARLVNKIMRKAKRSPVE